MVCYEGYWKFSDNLRHSKKKYFKIYYLALRRLYFKCIHFVIWTGELAHVLQKLHSYTG